MSKGPSFIQRFVRQHVNVSQTQLTSARNRLYTPLPLICKGSSRKSLVLVKTEFLRQFINTLTADYKYSRWNRENLWQQVLMQISRKPKIFSGLFLAFLRSTLKLAYFQRKDQSQILSVTEIINCETDSYLNVQKAIIHATFRQTTC